LNDQHIPFHDKKVNKLVFDFIADFQPDIVDILGDLTDFWQISHFDKDPKRKGTIQNDIDSTHTYLEELRKIVPNAEIELHAGNHLDRMRKYIWRQAEELNCIRSLSLEFLLGLKELNISYLAKAEDYRIRGELVLLHGTIIRKKAGDTAKANLDKYGLSVICGHSHRGGSTYRADLLGTRGAWENFCLCDFKLAKEWRMDLADWQQGFSYIYYYPDRFEVHQVPIIKQKFTVLGKEYGNGKQEGI
jgi:hypothetical protein